MFRMATYHVNMLHSPLDSVPVLHHGLSLHSRSLQRGACDAARLAAAIWYPLYAWNLHQAAAARRRRGNAQTKTTSLDSEILPHSFERSGSSHHIYLEEANWFNLPCLHHTLSCCRSPSRKTYVVREMVLSWFFFFFPPFPSRNFNFQMRLATRSHLLM